MILKTHVLSPQSWHYHDFCWTCFWKTGCLNDGEEYVVFIHLMLTSRFCFSCLSSRIVSFFLTPLSVLLSAFSVTNLFLFTSSPVFCSVSLFICSPFNLFFFGFSRVKVPAGGEKTNFDCFFFFLKQLWSKKRKKETWRVSFNLWNLNLNELN